MATNYKLEVLNGPADFKCSVTRCTEAAVSFASYDMPGGPNGTKTLRRPYCMAHCLMFGAKHKLLECRNGDIYLKMR